MRVAPLARLALIGGLIFGRYHDALLDVVLGLAGGALVAQGLITLAAADFLDDATMTKLRVEEFYLYYVGAIAVLIELLRGYMTAKREAAFSRSPRQVLLPPRDLSRKSLSPGRSAPVSPANNKAKNLSMRTPSMQ